jgi:hypothetical protein
MTTTTKKTKASTKKAAAAAATAIVEDVISSAPENHILLKLPLSDQQLDSILHNDASMTDVLKYVPTINDPEPYEPVDSFASDADFLPQSVATVECCTASNNQYVHDNTSHSMDRKQKICFWCCHEVGHITYGMPIRYDFTTKSFTMYGTFCSLECSAAHNFSVHLGSDRAWEIHSWIQMLGKRYGFKEPIRPAPSRYLLDMFDGPLNINEFRNAHKGQLKTYVLNIPPLISVNSQMEVVNTSFIGTSTPDPPRKTSTRRTLDAKLGLMIEKEST